MPLSSCTFATSRGTRQLISLGAMVFFIFLFSKDVSIIKAEDSNHLVQGSVSAPDSSSITLSGAAEKRGSAFLPMRGRREDGDDVTSEDKRARSFMPMRGRREDDKRGSAFLPMRGRKGSYQDIARELVAKRLRSFMPMRGKKSDEDDLDEVEKRARSFMPMRGKKEAADYDGMLKRGSYFMPMRGRKDDGDKRGSSFLPMRGRKDDDKRVSGFLPMRGRKSEEPDDGWPLDQSEFMVDDDEKRAFHAMRGKKMWYPETGSDNVDGFVSSLRQAYDGSGIPEAGAYVPDDAGNLQQMAAEEKRGSSSFFGMRGKREVHPQSAPPQHEVIDKMKDESFFASRGKRSTNVRTSTAP